MGHFVTIYSIYFWQKISFRFNEKEKGVCSQIDFGQSVGESSMLSYEPNHWIVVTLLPNKTPTTYYGEFNWTSFLIILKYAHLLQKLGISSWLLVLRCSWPKWTVDNFLLHVNQQYNHTHRAWSHFTLLYVLFLYT